MANRSTFAYRNWAWESGVTITSSADATGYPSSNLSSSAPWKIWRSSVTTGDQWVKFDLGSSRAMTACLLRNVLIHSGGSVRFQANATDSWSAPTIDSVFTVPSTMRTKVLALFFASQSLRWVRIYFTNTTAASSAVELGIAFPTDRLDLTRAMRSGATLSRSDLSLAVSSVGGQVQADRRDQQYVLDVDPNELSATDRDSLLSVLDFVGTHTPWFLVLDTDDPNLIVYGRFVGGLPVQHNPQSGSTWTSRISFVEDL